KGQNLGVYRFCCPALHLNGRAFHVLSGGTICGVSALTTPFTASNFLAISWVRLLLCGWFSP
ncbi:TPA: hypothetical protein ACMDSY_004529, partial [Vibrio parahaemolyticus]